MPKPPVVAFTETNSDTIECSFYSTITNVAYTAAIGSLFTGQFWASLGATAVGGAAELAAGLAGCNDKPEPPSKSFDKTCWNVPEGGDVGYTYPYSPNGPDYFNKVGSNAVEIYRLDVPDEPEPNGTYRVRVFYRNLIGQNPTGASNIGYPNEAKWFIRGGACADPEPYPPKQDEEPIGPTTPFDDPDSDCFWSITPINARVNSAGLMEVYYKVEANDPACGGPYYFWTGRDGPRYVQPTPGPEPTPPDDYQEPMTCDLQPVLDKLDRYLGLPLSGITYALNSICELDENGNPKTYTVEREISQQIPLVGIAQRIDALVPLLQGQKDFKQPVCPPVKGQGDLRTISFRSEEISPNGKSCLRKRLRYRSLSGIGLDALIDYWKDFSFQAGPVIVKHIGSTLGSLTVWAASIDEGKRVILHAAGEAGVNANKIGRWEISGSASTRRGMPGTMNIDITGGYYWITARDGSTNRPIVGKT